MEQLIWVQDSAFATWLRESSWALFALLIVHTLTMGALIGTGLVIDARMLGLARRIPLPALGRVLPVMVWAVGFAIASGILLLMAYPAKALTNVLFPIKLVILTAAIAITWQFARHIFAPGLSEAPRWARPLAALSMLLWVAGLFAGKFLEYTHHMLLAY